MYMIAMYVIDMCIYFMYMCSSMPLVTTELGTFCYYYAQWKYQLALENWWV